MRSESGPRVRQDARGQGDAPATEHSKHTPRRRRQQNRPHGGPKYAAERCSPPIQKTCEKPAQSKAAKTSNKALYNGLSKHSGDHHDQQSLSLYSKLYPLHAAPDADYAHDDDGDCKPNTHIRVSQALRIIECAGYAFCIGKPLNRFLTIDFPAYLPSSRLKPTLGDFLKYASDWLRIATGLPPYYVWSLENKNGIIHAHILIHVPRHLLRGFHKLRYAWLEQSGIPYGKGVLKSKPFKFSRPRDRLDDFLCKGLMGLLRYILKGVEEKRFGIDPKSQGEIVGKRCGYSEALSPSKWVWPDHCCPGHPKIRLSSPERIGRNILQRVWCDREGEHFPIPRTTRSSSSPR